MENYHNSSMIERSEYCKDSNKLIIEFKNGDEYEYYDVDEDTYESFVSASSIGKHFINNIRNSYSYAKI